MAVMIQGIRRTEKMLVLTPGRRTAECALRKKKISGGRGKNQLSNPFVRGGKRDLHSCEVARACRKEVGRKSLPEKQRWQVISIEVFVRGGRISLQRPDRPKGSGGNRIMTMTY